VPINPHKSNGRANPPAGFVQRDSFAHRGSACGAVSCAAPRRAKEPSSLSDAGPPLEPQAQLVFLRWASIRMMVRKLCQNAG
jgi:hypothetical protein